MTVWRDSEPGPECSCGNPRVVKLLPDGQPILMCLLHTASGGAWTPLLAQRPDDWPHTQ